jgi:hypothetical protein
MSETAPQPELISEDKAKDLVDSYLRNRYYDFDKLKFTGVESTVIKDTPAYRIYGTVHVKSRSMFERIVHEKNASTYKFTVEINAINGRIINYVFE